MYIDLVAARQFIYFKLCSNLLYHTPLSNSIVFGFLLLLNQLSYTSVCISLNVNASLRPAAMHCRPDPATQECSERDLGNIEGDEWQHRHNDRRTNAADAAEIDNGIP